MKSCCSSTSNDSNCKRKDGKTFSLPRKFSKSKCKKPKGFSMKSSCAPYKYCKKGGKSKRNSSKQNNKKLTKKRVLLPKLRPINNKNVKHKYKLSDPQSKRILAIDEGIKDEAKKTGKTLKKAAISKKGRFNILRIYRKNKRPQECKRITSDMKYIDKKYGLGKTTNICKNKIGGKKDFLYNPDNPKKSFDVYIDKNPKDTIPIKYKTLDDVKSTIKKLESLYKNGKYTHKRIWQVGMIMKVRLESLKSKKPQQYKLANKYFKHLGERSKIKNENDRKKFVFKFSSIKKGGTIENKRSHSTEEPDKQTTKKQRLFDPTANSKQWPSFKGPGEILEINDLICCFGVIVNKYDEDGKFVGVVGGHFITNQAFSIVDNMLTDEGKYFMEDIFELLDEHDMTPDNTTIMLVIRLQANNKPQPITMSAVRFVKKIFLEKDYKAISIKSTTTKDKSSKFTVYPGNFTIRVPE